jgi:hypothetical protein
VDFKEYLHYCVSLPALYLLELEPGLWQPIIATAAAATTTTNMDFLTF